MTHRIAMMLAAMAAMATADVASARTNVAHVEVMVVGTYHFDNPGLDINNVKADDVLKPQRQAEIKQLVDALATFRPTKIMVERVVNEPGLADPRFAAFVPADLGKDRDERVQIGYRLARQIGVPVFGIDEQPAAGEPDYFPFQPIADWAKANAADHHLSSLMASGAALAKQLEADQKSKTIPQMLIDRNRPEAIAREQTMYYGFLAFGDTDKQPGADLNAMWYLRNAKIFAKMQKVAQPGDRVIVIYGTGHNYWLRHFAATAPGYQLVEAVPYLEKAGR